MAKKHYIIGAGTIALATGLIISLSSGFHFGKAAPASASQVLAAPATSEKVETLKAEIDKAAQYELAHGCTTTDKFGHKEFCGESRQKLEAMHKLLVEEVRKLEQRDASAVAAVTANIRGLAGDPGLEVSFDSNASNPFTTDGSARIEQYLDGKGFMYIVNPSTNKVIQMGPGPGSKIQFTSSPRLTADALRAKAESFLTEKVEGFDQVKSEFSYREMSKPGNMSFAFRWEAKSKSKGEEMAPFVQVVLSPSGEVMSFSDTRSLYSQN